MWCQLDKKETWFHIIKHNKKHSNSTLVYEDVISDINLDDWNIYKSTNRLREATHDEVGEFKHASYFFYAKEHFDKNEINEKIELLYKIVAGGRDNIIMTRPLPPIEVFKKVRICGVK